jgi:hypothetical protein
MGAHRAPATVFTIYFPTLTGLPGTDAPAPEIRDFVDRWDHFLPKDLSYSAVPMSARSAVIGLQHQPDRAASGVTKSI